MTALSDVLAAAKRDGRFALIGGLTVGCPSVDLSIDAMLAMVEGGCDVIEVCVPYSDPVMDGPTIQAADEIALRNGVSMTDALHAAKAASDAGAAVVLMTYWNMVERYGVERFAADVAATGCSGVITPDLIPEEAAEWAAAADKHDLDKIFLVAPSSTDARIAGTAAASRGFVYATAVMGVTGPRETVSDAAEILVRRTRESGVDIPVCVGLGVSNREQAATIGAYADGVIVASAFVRKLLDSPDATGVDAIRELAQELTAGVRNR